MLLQYTIYICILQLSLLRIVACATAHLLVISMTYECSWVWERLRVCVHGRTTNIISQHSISLLFQFHNLWLELTQTASKCVFFNQSTSVQTKWNCTHITKRHHKLTTAMITKKLWRRWWENNENILRPNDRHFQNWHPHLDVCVEFLQVKWSSHVILHKCLRLRTRV